LVFFLSKLEVFKTLSYEVFLIDWSNVNFEEGADDEDNDEDLLVRKELFELTIRMANILHFKSAKRNTHKEFVKAYEKLMDQLTFYIPVDPIEFKTSNEDNGLIDTAFGCNKSVFISLFNTLLSKGSNK